MEDYRAILKRNREKQGLSQNKLAKRLGVTQTFISEIERGRKNPSLEQFFRICKELQIKVFPDEPYGAPRPRSRRRDAHCAPAVREDAARCGHRALLGACFSLSLCRGWGLPPPAGPRSAMCRRSDFQTCPGY